MCKTTIERSEESVNGRMLFILHKNINNIYKKWVGNKHYEQDQKSKSNFYVNAYDRNNDCMW
jgi:hypothetical protein